MMNISIVAERSGVSAKTIRYYESIGLIPSADRRTNGYRAYDTEDVHTLQFIRRARSLGFSVDEIRNLLDLWQDEKPASARVKALATQHLRELDQKIEELQSMRQTLADLVDRCRGNDWPDCPILKDLARSADA
jgi:MerR family copper efflux transcriptional regulator